MKDRRRRQSGPTQSRYLSFTIFFFFFTTCSLLLWLLGFLRGNVGHVLAKLHVDHELFNWKSFSDDLPAIQIRDLVMLSDQVLLIIDNSKHRLRLSKDKLFCTYTSPKSSQFRLQHGIIAIDAKDSSTVMVRCPSQSQAFNISLARKSDATGVEDKSTGKPLKQSHDWQSLAYEALIDGNTTVVFAKGLHLRPARLTDTSIFDCVFGYRFDYNTRFALSTRVVSAAQEIYRCETPRSLMKNYSNYRFIKVSIRSRYHKKVLPSIAGPRPSGLAHHRRQRRYVMCVCTMVRNQARFLREWITYHAHVGVQRWFIYDNGSDDEIDQVIESLEKAYNVTKHAWPWIKTQEAGFSHCALLAKQSCEWVAFIDVDEFLYSPHVGSIKDHLKAQLSSTGELRVPCLSFGPSSLSLLPERGVAVGYTCRMSKTERHKSIVRPEAISSELVNVVHHFYLKDDYEHVNVNKENLVVNHYKYQVWEVFKQKFDRRVATYVSDWSEDNNVGSKDRAPGLGTK